MYDESGSPIGLNYRTNQYAANVFDVFYFEKNLQGDIVAIYHDSGTRIGMYSYDAWGNFTVSATSGITALEQSILYSYNAGSIGATAKFGAETRIGVACGIGGELFIKWD